MLLDILHIAEQAAVAAVGIVLSALGTMVAGKVHNWFGAKASEAVTDLWQKALDAGANYALMTLHAQGEVPLASQAADAPIAEPITENHPVVADALSYMKQSFPVAFKKVGQEDWISRLDIVAAIGKKLFPRVGAALDAANAIKNAVETVKRK